MYDLDWDEGYTLAGDVCSRDALAVPPEMHTYERCMPEMHARALLFLAK